MAITYRMLPLQEWARLEPLYSELFPDSAFPSPEMSSAAVAENENGTIVGFWFFQLCAHLEPVGLDPVLGQEVSLHGLQTILHETLANCSGMEYYISTPDPRLGEILEGSGYKPVGVTFSGRVP
jgi:hypothetical protein